jgi:hypothetical protein
VDLLGDTKTSDLRTECRHLLELPQRPSTPSSSVHDAYRILALRAAKTACSGEEREYAQSGTRAQHREPKVSKNLLNGVADSLRQHLQMDTKLKAVDEAAKAKATEAVFADEADSSNEAVDATEANEA